MSNVPDGGGGDEPDVVVADEECCGLFVLALRRDEHGVSRALPNVNDDDEHLSLSSPPSLLYVSFSESATMRPTDIRRSEMPGPKVYNLWWGDRGVQKQKGIVTYSLSPFRQRAAHKMITNWVFNGYRRLSSQAVYWVIPFAMDITSLNAPASQRNHVVFPFWRHPLLILYLCFDAILTSRYGTGCSPPYPSTGYATYSWAKRYDAWQNSKAAHVAGHHEH
ncbi:hypothetical protein NUW54_g3547 [Trametes sanguinea]|uniref:Uncharacterized protein n=1 Tax=Trametes sanguinea TaxID=158606 RepID=A0ACC1Q0F7_9APHY|nr:hypothetical protein NUW54_g3547 [Trametes sanguinea]